MPNVGFNVNTDAVIHLTAKLERLRKSAFPSAVRATLSDAAFDMKKTEILKSAKKNMNVKNPTFFKAFTGVVRAKGSNVNSMSSVVGFMDKNKDKAQKAVNKGMESNEIGGTDNDGLKYYPATRGSRGLVIRSKYYDKEKVIKDSQSTFMQNAFKSIRDKKPVFIQTKKGTALVQFKKAKRAKRANKVKSVKRGQVKFNSTLLMLDRTKLKAKAKATHFNKEAALQTQKSIDVFYAKNAEYQFNKHWR